MKSKGNTGRRLICMAAMLTFVCSAASFRSYAWGRQGHDAVAYIAELNLTDDTKSIVESYLDGKSIVYYASWPDQIRFIHEYALTYMKYEHWAGFSSDLVALGRDGGQVDALYQINEIMERLGNGKYKNLPKEEVAIAIKYLTHVVGDIHCPVHMHVAGRKENINVTHNGEKMRFHHFWDDMSGKAHSWSYSEYGHQLNRFSREKIEKVTAGDVFDWGEQAVRDTQDVWEYAEDGAELGKPYVYKVTPVFDELIATAGYRLAYVLNTIFR